MEFTRLDIHQVYKLNIVELLNYMSYIKSKILYNNKKAKQRMAELKRRHGRK